MKMDHKTYQDKLSEYRDGELGESQRREVESHVSSCAECAAVLRDYASLGSGLARNTSQTSASGTDFFVNKVMDRIHTLESVSSRRVRIQAQWFAPAFGIAAMLILALIPTKTGYSADMLLMNNISGNSVDWVVSSDAPLKDDMLRFVMEER